MRMVVLSDIHANMAALRRVLADLPSYDEFYCLGDIVGYGPDPNEVVEALRTLRPTIVLAGNHDYAVVTGNASRKPQRSVQRVRFPGNTAFATQAIARALQGKASPSGPHACSNVVPRR